MFFNGGITMTISRKLLIAGALLVGMQPITQAYDVVGLKEEVKMISYFIERNNVDIEHEGRHINLGTWLQYKINCTYRTSNYDIIEIANIINTPYNTIPTLLTMEKKEYQNNQAISDLFLVGLVATYAALFLIILQKRLDLAIDRRVFSSEIKSLVLIEKLQQQIDTLTKQTSNKWF